MESGVDSNGMSSETIILTGRWDADGQAARGEVGGPRRAQPNRTCRCSRPTEMDHQFDVIRLVGENDRRPGAAGALARADRRRAGHAVLPDGLRVRGCPARCDALHVRRQLVRRLPRRVAARTAGQHRRRAGEAARDPRCRDHIRVPGRRRRAERAAAKPRLAEVVVPVRGSRHRPVPARRAGAGVAGGELARGRRRHRSRC